MSDHDGLLGGDYSSEMAMAMSGIEPYSTIYGCGGSSSFDTDSNLSDSFDYSSTDFGHDMFGSFLSSDEMESSDISALPFPHKDDGESMFADVVNVSDTEPSEYLPEPLPTRVLQPPRMASPKAVRVIKMRVNKPVNYRHSKLHRWLTRHFPRCFPDRGYLLMDYVDQNICRRND